MQVPQNADKLHPVKPDYGQDRAELDEDEEGILLAACKAKPVLGQDQVTRGGDRDEFRKALHDPQNGRFKKQQKIHSAINSYVEEFEKMHRHRSYSSIFTEP